VGAVWPVLAWLGKVAGILRTGVEHLRQLVQPSISVAWLQRVRVFSLMAIVYSLVAANEPVANKTSEAN
jgi:hypothetical protein